MQRGREVPVPLVVAVPDEDALVAGQHAVGVDRGRGPVPGMHVRQPLRAGQVHVTQAPGRAGRGLVCVDRLRFFQQAGDQVHEAAGLHQGGALRPHAGDPAQRHADPGQFGHQHRRPSGRDVVPAGQVRRLRMNLRPEGRSRPDPGRQGALGHRPAARAPLRLRDMLGDLGFRCRQDAGDLVAPRGEDLLAFQARPASCTFRGRVPVPVPRVIDQLHRGAGLARLLARSPLALLPQGPVPRRLLLIRAVRRRRPRRRARIPRACRSSRSTRALSSLISRYASASRAASSSCGRAASSPAVGKAGSAGTAPTLPPGTARHRPRQEIATSPRLPRNQQ